MTQEQILQLTCAKHIKIWKLKQLGLSNSVIAGLLGTNPGHVWNTLKEYAQKPERAEIAAKL